MPPRELPPHVSIQAVVYRATSYDAPVRIAENRRSGRWNFAHSGTVQYLCLDTEAPFAEKLRHEDLGSEEEAATYRTTLWQLKVNEGFVVDYSTFEKAERAGFPPEALVDDDHEACRREAQRLISLGAGGVLSPSAALPGSVNLTLFGRRVPIRWDAQVQISSAIPAQRLATGQPPEGLVSRVRFYGNAHPDLVHYLGEDATRVRRLPPGSSQES
jgi:RES domain